MKFPIESYILLMFLFFFKFFFGGGGVLLGLSHVNLLHYYSNILSYLGASKHHIISYLRCSLCFRVRGRPSLRGGGPAPETSIVLNILLHFV